jgi:MFS family permease
MRWLRALYVSNGLAVGSLYGFIPVLLASKGFDPVLVGVATSLGSLSYTMALPAWGHVGDALLGPRRALQLACLPAAVFALGLAAPLPIAAVILCQVLLSVGSGPAMALTDAMVVPELENPSREYGRLRLLTSTGAASSAAACGILYTFTGYMAAPIVYLFVIAATLTSAHFVKLGRQPMKHEPLAIAPASITDIEATALPRRQRGGSLGETFAIRPRMYGILASVVLIFIGVMAAGTYVTLRITDLGGGPFGVGLSNAIAWSAEVPGMILAGWLIARFGARSVLVVCSTGFAACIGSWVVLADFVSISITRFASGIFFAGVFVSFVLTISAILPPRLQSTGQTLLQAACFGFAAVVANLLGGLLYQLAGPVGVFGGGALSALVGGIVGVVVLPSEADAQAVSPAPPSASLA